MRVDLPDLLRYVPAAHRALQADIGDERPVVLDPAPDQGQRLFARRQNVGFKTAVDQRGFDDTLQRVLVFDDENEGDSDNANLWFGRSYWVTCATCGFLRRSTNRNPVQARTLAR